MLLAVLDGDDVGAGTSLDSHAIVRDGGKGGNEGSQDVEQAFLLFDVSAIIDFQELGGTYHWHTEGHHVESDGGEKHEDEDDPVLLSSRPYRTIMSELTIVSGCLHDQLSGR